MNYKNILNIFSVFINLSLILIIIFRSPNEQSLQENLAPFQFFESSSKTTRLLDKGISSLTICYFVIGLLFSTQRYF